jgi:hypothetical protein
MGSPEGATHFSPGLGPGKRVSLGYVFARWSLTRTRAKTKG